jgi:hypothetical protein
MSEHAIVLVSIIMGLGLTDLLGNFSRLVRARARVRWDGLPLAWALFALLLVVNFWWGLYLGVTGIGEVASAGGFLAALLLPTLLYLVCTNALPEAVPEQGLDMGAAYDRQQRFFFGLLLAYFVLTAIQVRVVLGEWRWTTVDLVRLASISGIAALIWTRTRWIHWLAAVACIGVVTLRLFTQVVR